MSIYIQSVAQISVQNPLSNSWLDNPIFPVERYCRAIDPDFKPFIPPVAARRMGKLLKRALTTSAVALSAAGIEQPDAIISGTGLGCIENTEKFLQAMVRDGETCLQPTYFMQSTHNTISSQIAVQRGCHGYNSTYSHQGTSFESALFDAFQQISLCQINHALVGAHDEMTPDYFRLLDQIGQWRQEDETTGPFASEVSVSFVLENQQRPETICQLLGVDMFYRPMLYHKTETLENMANRYQFSLQDIDALFVGINGDEENDEPYLTFHEQIMPHVPLCHYKHLFGESYAASSIGMYVAAICLQQKSIGSHLLFNTVTPPKKLRKILIYNHFQNKNHSFILLQSC